MASKMQCLEKANNNHSNDYMTEGYKKYLETLIQKKNLTGQFNEPKCIGPLFWKNALIKTGLREEEVLPKQFEGQLVVTECRSCEKSFARSPTSSNKGNILTSKSPCSTCFVIKNKFTLYGHKTMKHSETPPYICQKCLLESDTWYKYVTHMKMHLRYEGYCSECAHMMIDG